jgi:hypothetical protein
VLNELLLEKLEKKVKLLNQAKQKHEMQKQVRKNPNEKTRNLNEKTRNKKRITGNG